MINANSEHGIVTKDYAVMEEDMSLLYRVRPELQGMAVFDALVQ